MQAKLGDSIIIIGNATKDATYSLVGSKNTPNCKWSMAIGKDANDQTIFANCEAWTRLAGIAKDIKKGDPVLVIGKVREHEYEGKTYKTLIADWVQFVGSAKQTTQVQPQEPQNEGFETLGDNLDDLPF